jgi:putative heme transporter
MADELATAGYSEGASPESSAAAGAAGSPVEVSTTARRTLGEVLRYVLGIAIGIVVLALLFGRRGELAAAARQIGDASPGWVAAAIGAESLSLLGYARLQQRVLHYAGALVPLPGLFLLSLANDAVNCTIPGEPAVSSAYRYRYYRRRGASAAGAGWTIFTILIAQAVGMSAVLLAGVVIALVASAAASGAGASPAGIGVTAVGLVIVLAAGAVLVRRDLVLRLLSGLAGRLQRRAGRRPGGLLGRIEATLVRMREIPLSPRSTVSVVGLATAVWIFDFLCLVCAFSAVHAAVPWRGVLLAYGASVVAGSLPIVPGGLGIVEGSLAVVLVAYGASRVPAVSAVLAFRIVNYWLAIAVGWASAGLIAFQFRRRSSGASAGRHRRLRPQ